MDDPKPITIRLKLIRGACPEQKAIFKKEWPKGAVVNLENVLRAVDLGLNLTWGTRWFTPDARAEYERQHALLWAEYERQHAPLWAEYDRQTTPLWAEYERQHAPLWAELDRQRAPLWAEYERQRAPLWAELDRQHATLWVAAMLASQSEAQP